MNRTVTLSTGTGPARSCTGWRGRSPSAASTTAAVDVPPSAIRPKDFALPDEFVAHSPRLEIPMVRVGEEYLADSIPVLEWLEAVVPEAPPLLPRDDGGATLVRERCAESTPTCSHR